MIDIYRGKSAGEPQKKPKISSVLGSGMINSYGFRNTFWCSRVRKGPFLQFRNTFGCSRICSNYHFAFFSNMMTELLMVWQP